MHVQFTPLDNGVVELSLETPAKFNAGLWVGAKRPDGFHAVDSVMVPLPALADSLVIRIGTPKAITASLIQPPPPEGLGDCPLRWQAFTSGITDGIDDCGPLAIAHTGFIPEIAPEQEVSHNLMARAATLFCQALNVSVPGLWIGCHKRIPMQAGLGGGSSNAAGVLLALKHWALATEAISPVSLAEHLPPLSERLMTLSAHLGSDVPFFMQTPAIRPAVVSGRGEQIAPIASAQTTPPFVQAVVIKPHKVAMSTAVAYQTLAELRQGAVTIIARNIVTKQSQTESSVIHSGDCHVACEYAPRNDARCLISQCLIDGNPLTSLPSGILHNDFDSVFAQQFPRYAGYYQQLTDLGASHVLLCGSGAAFIGLFDAALTSAQQAQVLETFVPAQFWLTWV